VVSLKKLIKGGIEWLTKEDKLMLGNRLFCLVEERFGQWVLEYNPQTYQESEQPSTFVVRSAQARTSKAPVTVWHERLAHCGPEVLEYLPTSVIGVKLSDGLTTAEYKIYGVSKAHKIISRRPSP
jgi:hypothetical protein